MHLPLVFLGLLGYYCRDEEESQMTLMFWRDLQETLLSTIDHSSEGEDAYIDWAEAAGKRDMNKEG